MLETKGVGMGVVVRKGGANHAHKALRAEHRHTTDPCGSKTLDVALESRSTRRNAGGLYAVSRRFAQGCRGSVVILDQPMVSRVLMGNQSRNADGGGADKGHKGSEEGKGEAESGPGNDGNVVVSRNIGAPGELGESWTQVGRHKGHGLTSDDAIGRRLPLGGCSDTPPWNGRRSEILGQHSQRCSEVHGIAGTVDGLFDAPRPDSYDRNLPGVRASRPLLRSSTPAIRRLVRGEQATGVGLGVGGGGVRSHPGAWLRPETTISTAPRPASTKRPSLSPCVMPSAACGNETSREGFRLPFYRLPEGRKPDRGHRADALAEHPPQHARSTRASPAPVAGIRFDRLRRRRAFPPRRSRHTRKHPNAGWRLDGGGRGRHRATGVGAKELDGSVLGIRSPGAAPLSRRAVRAVPTGSREPELPLPLCGLRNGRLGAGPGDDEGLLPRQARSESPRQRVPCSGPPEPRHVVKKKKKKKNACPRVDIQPSSISGVPARAAMTVRIPAGRPTGVAPLRTRIFRESPRSEAARIGPVATHTRRRPVGEGGLRSLRTASAANGRPRSRTPVPPGWRPG